MEACISIVGSILGSLAGKAAEYAVDPIAQQLGYLFNHKSKFQNLQNKAEELKAARERLQQSVDQANRNGEEIFADVETWLTKVNKKISDHLADTQLQEDEEKAMKRCFAGFCPPFKSRYQLSKKAERKAETIDQLLGEKDQFDGVSYLPPIKAMSTIRPVKEYEAFESRSGAFDGVMVALEDDNVSVIGVYGMGGVGKTTLVKEVARKAKEKQLFDEVVLVAITQTPDMMKTQNEIVENLGLKIEETSMAIRAARLHDRLKKIKKVLIILDDLWATVDLEEVGVPSIDEHKGCKILMTSRRHDILGSMSSQQNFSIETLKEDEAWNLFRKMAGCIGSDLESTAKKISKKCAGLPIAIATIAKALKQKQDSSEWKAALRQLSKPSERNFKGIPEKAYKAIELSYKFIEAEELGQIFLLCSIMGHNAATEDLLRYTMGLGLIHDVNTMEETRDKLLALMNNLKASCLLLDGSDSAHFDIHDVVRDVALSIASRDQHWLALGSDDVFEGWPDEERMKNCRLISLQNAKVRDEDLNHELECPNLTFLSMHCSEDSCVEIPNYFFKGMQGLKVLDFALTRFTSSNIGSLKNLKALRLIGCDVQDVVILGELTNLEILDLRESDIAELPKEIGQLTKLKLLDLSDCGNLSVISPNVLSRLSRLEELYLYGSFDGWEVVEGGNETRNGASVDELQRLSRLTTLELHIPDVLAIPKDSSLFFGNLERYKISIGDSRWEWYHARGMKTSRMLKLSMTKKSIHSVDGIKQLLRKVESLNVDGVEDVGEMLYNPITEGLKHLRVQNVLDVKVVINSKMKVPCLESLYLRDLRNLEAIWEDSQLNADSFDQKVSGPGMKELELDSLIEIEKIRDDDQLPPPIKMSNFGVQSLTSLTVSRCHELKYVFSSCMVRSFVQLKTLAFWNCSEMEEVIEEGILLGEREKQVFPKLDSLVLWDLPRLKRFCSGSNLIEFPSLKKLWIEKCPVLKTFCWDTTNVVRNVISHDHLFNQKVSFPAIKELGLHSLSGIERIWHDDVLWLTSLASLKVYFCHKLKYVFSSYLVINFDQLKTLAISECDEMEEVIEEGILLGEGDEKQVFPKLDSLKLSCLTKLKRFYGGFNPIELPSLRELWIERCPVLKTFHCDTTNAVGNISHDHLFNQKVILPVIEELKIWEMDNLERLWPPNQLAEQYSLSKLTTISLRNCRKLLYVFPSNLLARLQGLKELSVEDCESVEEIIFETDHSRLQQEGGGNAIQSQVIESDVIISFEFPHLTYLALVGLPNLKGIHRKKHTVNWPLLEEMEVTECGKLEIFLKTTVQRTE